MEKTCFCCGKEVKFMDYDLKDGSICRECFELVSLYNSKITYRNINLYTCEEISEILNSIKNTDTTEDEAEVISNNVETTETSAKKYSAQRK